MEAIRELSDSGKNPKVPLREADGEILCKRVVLERGSFVLSRPNIYIAVHLPPPSCLTPYTTIWCFDITTNLQKRRQNTPSQKRAFQNLKKVLLCSRRLAVLSCKFVSFFKMGLPSFLVLTEASLCETLKLCFPLVYMTQGNALRLSVSSTT